MKFTKVQFPNGDFGLAIDTGDLNIDNKESLVESLLFRMNSYEIGKARKRSRFSNEPEIDTWDKTYAVSNRMLESMPAKAAEKYVLAMAEAHKIVDSTFSSGNAIGMESMAHKIGDILDTLDKEVGICDYIFGYITEHVPFALTPDAGRHAQDSQEMTWYPEQAHVLMTIVLLCKIVSPIFGLVATYLPENLAPYRDAICSQTLMTLLDRKYPEIVTKLQYYIKKIASRSVKEDKSALMNGITIEGACFSVYTSLLTRTYVNVNLMATGSNPITMTHVNIKKIIGSHNQKAIKHKAEERRPPTISSSDDDRIAQMEIDSMTSRKTADVVPITRFAVRDIIKRVKAEYDISDDDFYQSYGFYLTHPIVPNVINRNMNAVFYGKALGGSRGLLLLKSEEYTQLTCLLQLVLFTINVNYQELGHMMTASPAIGVSSGTLNVNTLKARATNSISYKNIKNMFESNPHGVNGKGWDKYVAEITENVTINKVLYNTSNFIWNWLEQDNLNGHAIDVTEKTIHAFCGMYEFVLEVQ